MRCKFSGDVLSLMRYANAEVFRPKSASGKILRRLLKDKLKKEAEDAKGGKTKL